MRRDCPICDKKNLAKLSNNLADIHKSSREERHFYLAQATSSGDDKVSDYKTMQNQKRTRTEYFDDEISTSLHDYSNDAFEGT